MPQVLSFHRDRQLASFVVSTQSREEKNEEMTQAWHYVLDWTKSKHKMYFVYDFAKEMSVTSDPADRALDVLPKITREQLVDSHEHRCRYEFFR